MRELVLFSLVDAFVATTIAEMKVAAPLRQLPWIGELLRCSWCTGFWIALVLVILFRPTASLAPGLAGFILDWFLVAFFSGMTSLLAKALVKLSGA